MLSALLLLLAGVFGSISAQSIVLGYSPNHSLKAPFEGAQLGRFVTSGDIEYTPKAIRLGHHRPSSKAAIWGRHPNSFPEWQVTMSFRIEGDKVGGGSDGLAFWYARNAGQSGPVYGGPNRWTGLGVFVDGWDNDGKGNNPAIMGSLSNGDVDWNMERDGEGQYFGGCIRNIRNTESPVFMRITYINKVLKVEIDDSGNAGVKEQYASCIERANVDLQPGYYFGFSAGTGEVSPDLFELHSFEIYQIQRETPKDKQSPPAAQQSLQASDEQTNKLLQQQQIMQSNLNAVIGQVLPGDRSIIQHFEFLEQEIRALNEKLRGLSELITKMLNKSAAVDPSALLHTLHDIRERTGRQLVSLEQQQRQFLQQQQVPADSLKQKYYGYFAFCLVQVFLLLSILTIKKRFEDKSKKFI